MTIKTIVLVAGLTCLFAGFEFAQTSNTVKRITTKTDRFAFGAGGTVSIIGSPNGSISVTGGASNEIEISAVIEIQASNEGDLARLAGVTTFVTDESALKTSIISVGTHDKAAIKRLDKNFPKNLIGLPFRIDYTIRVPRYTDLEIDGGKGDLSITGVEGSMTVNFLHANARVEVNGGSVNAVFGTGNVNVAFGVKGWRGRPGNVRVAAGNLTVQLPANASAEIDATILKTGTIVNEIGELKPRDRKAPFTDRSILATAGAGGASLKFTVGNGTIKLAGLVAPR